jgi:glutamate racemase
MSHPPSAPAPLDAASAPAIALPTPVGVFDSGVGGLSVLRALHRHLPGLPLHYVADSAHAPYGDRDTPHVLRRSQRIVKHLVDQGARLVVVACNTATALAIDQLRHDFPEVDFVGVEPGVKPAALASAAKRIAVMATPATLASARYADVVARHAPGCEVHPVPCAGLAAAIEQGESGREEVERLLDRYCAPLNTLGVDTVVLGCTHYPFVAERIASRLQPGIALLDTADAVARRAAALLAPTASPRAPLAALQLHTTGDPALLMRMALAGLGQELPAARVEF